MKIALWNICISIINYILITSIVDILLMGRLSFTHRKKVRDDSIIIHKENSIHNQTGNQCSGYAAAYILRHYGIVSEGQQLYNIMPGKMRNGCVYPKGLRNLLESNGLLVTYCRGTMNDLKYEISKGNPVIVMILVQVDKKWFHYVPVVGYDEEYIYLAESLENLTNCEDKYYNRKVEIEEFIRLWNTATIKQPFYKNTYFRIRMK